MKNNDLNLPEGTFKCESGINLNDYDHLPKVVEGDINLKTTNLKHVSIKIDDNFNFKPITLDDVPNVTRIKNLRAEGSKEASNNIKPK